MLIEHSRDISEKQCYAANEIHSSLRIINEKHGNPASAIHSIGSQYIEIFFFKNQRNIIINNCPEY